MDEILFYIHIYNQGMFARSTPPALPDNIRLVANIVDYVLFFFIIGNHYFAARSITRTGYTPQAIAEISYLNINW